MIKQLKRRFIRITVLTLAIAMVLVVAIVNVTNLISVRRELADTLELIADNAMPDMPMDGNPPPDDADGEKGYSRHSDENLSGPGYLRNRLGDRSRHTRNMVLESSWFSAICDENGNVHTLDLAGMADTDEEAARSVAEQAFDSGKDSGYIGDYLFLDKGSCELSCGSRSVRLSGKAYQLMELFMENPRILFSVQQLMDKVWGWDAEAEINVVWVNISQLRVQPTIRNMEQQKQFITNASHELKTPLTVISTNMELVNMETPDNPWVRSTQKQVSAMKHLVDELVYLSRMEEEHPAMTMERVRLDTLLEETAEPFAAMAEYNGREMTVRADADLTVTGDRPSLQRLISTLCDNAAKYTPEGGTILAESAADGRSAVLRVSNTVETPLTKEQCAQLFNRFYRADPSRNKEKQGGFGIGLSIAAAIAEKHGGSIRAAMEGDRLVLTCTLPREKTA